MRQAQVPVVSDRKAVLDSYSLPNWLELQASVLAFCPDSVMDAFTAAKTADDMACTAKAAHAEAVELDKADPTTADPDRVANIGARVPEAD